MPKNVELKARLQDMNFAEEVCDSLPAEHLWLDMQVDTYFSVPNGRLKLRESGSNGNALIFYTREDSPESKESDYRLVPVPDDAGPMRDLLASSLGQLVQVRKFRNKFLFEETSIHLDRVEGLGLFIEFEYHVSETNPIEGAGPTLNMMKDKFRISNDDLIDVSYSDMLLKQSI